MSSTDVGIYQFKRSPWMQIEECAATLARSTSDGSADGAIIIIVIIIIVVILVIIVIIIVVIVSSTPCMA